MRRPISGEYPITQTFAEHEERKRKLGLKNYNGGIDWATPVGTPIYAAMDGVVYRLYVGDTGYGNAVMLDHGDGLQTIYAHLQHPLVRSGDKVMEGQMIGRSGNTGNSTAPHLHFEVRKDGKPVDPMSFLATEGKKDEKTLRVVAAGGANLRSTPMKANNLAGRLPCGFELHRADIPEVKSLDGLTWAAVICWIAKADEDGNPIVE